MKIETVITGALEENCYVLIKDGNCLVVDPGDDYHLIKEVIGDNKVLGVLITHSHFDHIYGINELHERFPLCNIYTSAYGYIALRDAKKNLSFYHEQTIEYLEDNIQILREGDKIEIFSNIYLEVLGTPGHCPSCLTYYTNDYIFTGDSYIPGIKVVTNLPKGNKIQAQESVEKIKELIGIRNICPGHGDIKYLM